MTRTTPPNRTTGGVFIYKTTKGGHFHPASLQTGFFSCHEKEVCKWQMKRPLAYLTAAWSGEPDIDMELAAHYCRLAYEAGFSPICPLLYLPLFLNDSVPEEHKAGIDMRRDMLRRSHTLIVCGSAVDEDVKNDIAVAGRLGIAATTLEGVLAVKGHGTPGHAGH